jgi:plastocyanin
MAKRNVSTWIAVASISVLSFVAAACGSSSSSPTSPGSGSGALMTVFIAGDRGAQSYSPNPMTVPVGQQVNWKNNDTTPHTATMDGGFNTGSIPPLSAHDNPVTFSTRGTFTYHCTIHPGMVGSIIVQ